MSDAHISDDALHQLDLFRGVNEARISRDRYRRQFVISGTIGLVALLLLIRAVADGYAVWIVVAMALVTACEVPMFVLCASRMRRWGVCYRARQRALWADGGAQS